MMTNYRLLIKYKAKKIIPKVLQEVFRKNILSLYYQNIKSKNKIQSLKNKATVSEQVLKNDLIQLGVKEGMKVMVHSSLPGLGYVEGGAKTVIKVLINIIGEKGLLVMPSAPKLEYSEVIRGDWVFNVRETECATGIICETFRKSPDVFRSAHPTHSISAWGSDADWLVKDHHLDDTPFGDNSPFARLMELGGYILGIGLDTRWITFYHHFEDTYANYPIQVYLPKKILLHSMNAKGKMIDVTTYCHDNAVSSVRLNNAPSTRKIIDQALTDFGNISRGKIGEGTGFIIKTKSVMSTLEKILLINKQTIYNLELLNALKPESINWEKSE
jgi:aminoglycoside 3-N-acetyltransferase